MPASLAFAVSALTAAAAPPFSDIALARAASASAIRLSIVTFALATASAVACLWMDRRDLDKGLWSLILVSTGLDNAGGDAEEALQLVAWLCQQFVAMCDDQHPLRLGNGLPGDLAENDG